MNILLAQAKTSTNQQGTHKIIVDAMKATYNEVATFQQYIENEFTPLKGKATGQKEAVETLTDKIKATLLIQWEDLMKKLGTENNKIIEQKVAEFDQIKADLQSLH